MLVRSAVGVKEVLITVLLRCFQVRVCDIPIGSALYENYTQILAEIFDCGSAKEPVAVVYLLNDKTGLKHNCVWNHRIMEGIRVFGNIKVFLHYTPGVGQGGASGRQLRCEIH
jgi:hypothetical protein